MITIKELAEICNVSPSTISNIINQKPNVGKETRERVLRVMESTGYQSNFFASGMRKQKSQIIALIVEDLGQFTTVPVVEAAMGYLEDMGYRTILFNLRMYDRWADTWFGDEQRLANELRPVISSVEAIRADGVIYVAGHGRMIHCFPETYNKPTVMAYAVSMNNRFPSVMIDDQKGGYDMAKYLIAKGHKKIAVLSGRTDNMHTQKRLEGFQRALFEESIPYNPEWLFEGDWDRNNAYGLAESILTTGATAVWCMNDDMAVGLYRYMFEYDMVPGRDISLAGFDRMTNVDILTPTLVTMELPLKEIGKRSAEMLIKVLENDGKNPEEMKSWVPCPFIEGDSVADIRP